MTLTPGWTFRRSGGVNDADGDDGVEEVEVDGVAVVPEELAPTVVVLADQRAGADVMKLVSISQN